MRNIACYFSAPDCKQDNKNKNTMKWRNDDSISGNQAKSTAFTCHCNLFLAQIFNKTFAFMTQLYLPHPLFVSSLSPLSY